MIKFNSDDLDNFLSVSDRAEAYRKAEKAYKDLCDGNIPGSEWLGWRRIVAEPDDAEIEEIVSFASEVRHQADVFIVCGIGGSYTGAMAVIRALNPLFGKSGPEILYAGHHMSGKYLKELIQYISTPFEDGRKKSVYLNVISKSGTTLETALAFRQIRGWMHSNYEDAEKRIIATTGPSGGVLNKIIEAEGYKKYLIPDDVGGRFSVLTPVGLLPIAVAGIDIRTLFYGAVSYFRNESENILNLFEYASARYLLHEKGYAVDVIGTFEPELFGITAWIQQLIGESEGKDGMGLYPALSGFSTDLHSVGQLIQQGRRNICETLLVVDEPLSDYSVDAGNSYGVDDACGSEALVNEEYVFSFTPTADMQINIALQNTAIVTDALLPMAEIGLFITELCPDDDLAVCVASNDELQSNPTLENVDLTSGVTYFIIVSSANASNIVGESPTNVNFDIEITENMAKDLGITDISGVISSCGLTDQETITCEIENFGYQSATNFDIGITINGSAPHVETYTETIAAGATANFTFTSLFDLSNVGEYIIEVFTDLNGDENADNDNLAITIVNTPSHSLSYVSEVSEDFEDGTAYWTVSGTNSSWELGTPNDTVTINYAASGENCWATNLDGTANTGENSFLESPCYNLAALTLPTVEFNIWRTFGLFGNTGSLEASLDGGNTWEETIVEWSGTSDEWEFVSVQMNNLVGQPNVRFRFNYNSGFMAGEGMAIDDFTITEAY